MSSGPGKHDFSVANDGIDSIDESMPLRGLSTLVLAAWQTERAFLGLLPLPLSPPPTVKARWVIH